MTAGKALSAVALFSAGLYTISSFAPFSALGIGGPTLAQAEIPSFGLGTWLSEKDEVSHAVEYALKLGYRHVDAARIYRNEQQVGKGIAASGVPRSDVWITSKLWNSDHRPELVREAIGKSLADLGVEYLDLYLIHWPVAFIPGDGTKLDNDTTLIDTWLALEDLVRTNLTKHIGVSNFAPRDIDAILEVATIKPYAHEFETHPYLQQQDFVDYHAEKGIKVIAYSPLANTNPTYDPNIPSILDDPFWKKMADRKNSTVAQAVLAWGQQRGTIVIPKSTHEKYIKENFASQVIEYTDEELDEISKQDKKIRLLNPSEKWGVDLFKGLDGSAKKAFGSDEL